jgi:NTP pyrophosphatase (non-canonical NTP hydrolase)
MDMNQYQHRTAATVIYPKDVAELYCALGLGNEAGEVQGVVKKGLRDGVANVEEYKERLVDELGDVLWYVARLADEINIPLNWIASQNLAKLESRKERGTLSGSGDHR